MLVNTVFLASLGFLTLPLYTITVQMGGDFKAQLLSKEIVQNSTRARSLKARSTLPLCNVICFRVLLDKLFNCPE